MYIYKEKIRKIKYLKIMKNQKLLKNLITRWLLLGAMLLGCSASVWAYSGTIYFVPTDNWKSNNAWFAAYIYTDNVGSEWKKLEDDGEGHYAAEINNSYDNIIFCRMDKDKSALEWGSKWNQSGDIKPIPSGKNLCTQNGSDWDSWTGTWSTYTPPTKCVTFTTPPSSDNHLYRIGDAAATLTVAAASSDGTTVTYQWYSNTTRSNTGGTVISGATSASYTPSTSTLGILYYYCEATGCDPEETVASSVSGGYTVYKPNIVIRVKKEGLFSSGTPYIYAWYNDGSDHELTGAWKGAAMEVDLDNDGWYVYTVTTPYAPIKVIFNKNSDSDKTADIEGIVDDACYIVNSDKSYSTTDCPAPSGDAPTVLIADVPSVSGEIATLFGYLKLTGCQDVTDYGFIWSTTQSDIEGTTPSGGTPIKATYPTGDITVGNEGTEFKAEDKVFDPQSTIYYRAYARNAIGISYSEEIRSFSTSGCIKPVVTDIEVPASICGNAGTITATATEITGATYAWDVDGTVFTGATGTGNTATITVGAAGIGSITVIPTRTSDACQGNPFTLSDITVKDATITAKNLKVNDESTTEGETIDFCEGQEITFKITSDYDVTTYTWSFPTGWTITSGEGTKEVVVTASATSGTVSATIANDCNESATRTIEASVTAKPATPGTITGATSVCKGTPQTYSVEAVSGATGYEWIIPTGWTGTCSPEGSNTITATPDADAESGTIKVKATNDCGSSEYNTGIEVTVGGYSIAISGVGAKSDAATYPWEYMTLTATTDAENITWNCVYSGTVAADLTVFETNGKTAKLKSGADASETERYTVTASSTDGGCQTTSPGYDVYINAADIEICD